MRRLWRWLKEVWAWATWEPTQPVPSVPTLPVQLAPPTIIIAPGPNLTTCTQCVWEPADLSVRAQMIGA